jgi:hypothetical protein
MLRLIQIVPDQPGAYLISGTHPTFSEHPLFPVVILTGATVEKPRLWPFSNYHTVRLSDAGVIDGREKNYSITTCKQCYNQIFSNILYSSAVKTPWSLRWGCGRDMRQMKGIVFYRNHTNRNINRILKHTLSSGAKRDTPPHGVFGKPGRYEMSVDRVVANHARCDGCGVWIPDAGFKIIF